jgi:hypothetical protein
MIIGCRRQKRFDSTILYIVLTNWSEIKQKFSSSILLGNGSSISVDPRFSYTLLYEKVKNYSNLNTELLDLFMQYDTNNFELILRLLLETSQVNKVLRIQDLKTKEYYLELRKALIETIRIIHPDYDEVKFKLSKIATFLSRFNTVVNLNYDLLIYWAMMAFNAINGTWFKDCFVHGKFEKDFGFMRKPTAGAKGATLVFYPHGSLFLATEPFTGEAKLSSLENKTLLETVLRMWEQENYIPLFVSEGTSKEKFAAITRNNYLNTVYDDVLPRMSKSLLIYGWSLSEQDDHIINAIARQYVDNIAISVYKGNKNWEEFCDFTEEKIKNKYKLAKCNVYFFDAESPGCWIY